MGKYKEPKINITKVYTRAGDSGSTQLIGGNLVSKNDPRVRAYGNVEEINVYIGLCLFHINNLSDDKKYGYLLNRLKSIQNELFNLGTLLASIGKEESKIDDLPGISEDDIKLLEIDIDDMNSNLTPLSSFILPGGNEIIVAIHMARVVCRRAERRVVSINNRTYTVNPNIIIYINRLSDYLFVLGRWVSNQLKIDENLWSSNNISSSK